MNTKPIRIEIDNRTPIPIVVHPDQDSYGIPRVQSSRVRDFHVTGASSEEYSGAVCTTIRALSVFHAYNSCAWVCAPTNVSSASPTIKGIDSQGIW